MKKAFKKANIAYQKQNYFVNKFLLCYNNREDTEKYKFSLNIDKNKNYET